MAVEIDGLAMSCVFFLYLRWFWRKGIAPLRKYPSRKEVCS